MCKSIKFSFFLGLSTTLASLVFIELFMIASVAIVGIFGGIKTTTFEWSGPESIPMLVIMLLGAITFLVLTFWGFSKLSLYSFRKAMAIAESK